MATSSRTTRRFGPADVNSRTSRPANGAVQDHVVLWQNGCQSAAESIYVQFAHRVRKVVKYHLNRRFFIRCDIEDAVQIVFMEVFEQLRTGCFLFESDQAFHRWIRVVARNRTIKLVNYQIAERRSIDRESRVATGETFCSLVEHQVGHVHGCLEQTSVCELRDQLLELDPRSQAIVRLLEQNYSQAEIAGKLGCAPRTVRRSIQRIRMFMKDE